MYIFVVAEQFFNLTCLLDVADTPHPSDAENKCIMQTSRSYISQINSTQYKISWDSFGQEGNEENISLCCIFEGERMKIEKSDKTHF